MMTASTAAKIGRSRKKRDRRMGEPLSGKGSGHPARLREGQRDLRALLASRSGEGGGTSQPLPRPLPQAGGEIGHSAKVACADTGSSGPAVAFSGAYAAILPALVSALVPVRSTWYPPLATRSVGAAPAPHKPATPTHGTAL